MDMVPTVCAEEFPTPLEASFAILQLLPGQQQTSFGGEKYSGLASNLARLGRMRLQPGRAKLQDGK